MTVTYLSPNLVCRHTCSSTPRTRTPSKRTGSLMSRRCPSARTASFAVCHGHPQRRRDTGDGPVVHDEGTQRRRPPTTRDLRPRPRTIYTCRRRQRPDTQAPPNPVEGVPAPLVGQAQARFLLAAMIRRRRPEPQRPRITLFRCPVLARGAPTARVPACRIFKALGVLGHEGVWNGHRRESVTQPRLAVMWPRSVPTTTP